MGRFRMTYLVRRGNTARLSQGMGGLSLLVVRLITEVKP
jgi:hypothetical protein